jgi:hypothetical protein
MISYLQKKRFFIVLIPSIISHFLLLAFPIRAATFTNFAQYDLELKNFNQPFQSIASVGDGDATTIASDGFLSSFIDVDAKNLFTPTEQYAYSKSKTLLFGTTNNYLGDLQFSSSLLQSFSIKANDSLQFSLNSSLDLFNQTDDLASSNLSSLIKINVLLRDKTNQTITNILKVLGVINTNSNPQSNQDLFKFKRERNTVQNSYNELTFFGENNELIQNSFSGLYNKQFEKDTELELIIVTQSCNRTSNTKNSCKKIPEPSNNFILIDLLMVLIYVRFFLRIVK